jgi:hypothetical protein
LQWETDTKNVQLAAKDKPPDARNAWFADVIVVLSTAPETAKATQALHAGSVFGHGCSQKR